MAKKEEEASYWTTTGKGPYDILAAQSAGRNLLDNPRSIIPPLAGWNQKAETTGRDVLLSALMGLGKSMQAAQQASALGDPVVASLAALGGAASQPGPDAIAAQRQAMAQQSQLAAFESAPLSAVSPDLAKEYGLDPNTPMGALKNIIPLLQRQHSLEQQLALFMAGEAGKNARADKMANAPQVFVDPETGRTIEAPRNAKLLPKKERPTQGEFTVRGFADRAKSAEEKLNALISSGYDPTAIVTTRGELVPNAIKTEDDQAAEQVMRDFVSAVLRRESGAAIPVTEMKTEILKYFPMPGDKPRVVMQKAESRRLAMAALEREASRVPSAVGGGSGMVRIQAPDGSIGYVPQDQEKAAIAAGGKRL